LRTCPRCQGEHTRIVDALAGPARRPIRLDSS
jgi:hypothetical protein